MEEQVVKARIDKHGENRKVTVWTYDGNQVRAYHRIFTAAQKEERAAFIQDPTKLDQPLPD